MLLLFVAGLGTFAIIGKILASHEEAVWYQSIPQAYAGNWSGRATGKPGASPDGAPPVDGAISVYIPSGMTRHMGTAEVVGPGSQCAEEWGVDDIKAHSISFGTAITKGSDTICGDVDAAESEVIVTSQTLDRLSVKWVDYGYTVGAAILYRR